MAIISGVEFLAIIKGVARTTGDTDPTEVGLDPLNLLDTSGYACTDYQMRLPEMKGSSVFADSPLSDGRQLLSGQMANVKETIRAEINAGTMLQLAALLTKLGRMKQDCRDYWTAFHQIEPVYLKHQLVGEPGPRFALLYDISYVLDDPLNPNDVNRNITIAIEREPYWRGLAPGDNPKKWTYEQFFRQQFNSTVADITGQTLATTHNLVESIAVNNRVDYSTTSKQTYQTKNFIDIPGTSIPGDAPALVHLTVYDTQTSSSVAKTLFLGRFTPRTTALKTSGASTFFAQAMSFNVADMTAGANATIEADTGAPARQSNGTASRGKFTPADNNANIRFTVASRLINNHRGRFAAFLRARQHSGAQDDLSMWLEYGQSVPVFQSIILPSVHPIRQDGTGNTTTWPMTYMGVIEFPITGKSTVSFNGLGENGTADLTLKIWSQRTAGTTAVLYYSDVILIPLDEPSGYFVTPVTTSSNVYHYDNTGYYLHGSPETFAAVNTSGAAGTEYRGQDLYLTPRVDQRFYFFTMFADNTSAVDWLFSIVTLNIVPRWIGLRDV